MPPDPTLQIVEQQGRMTATLDALSRRIDDMAGAMRDLAAEKSSAHEKLHRRHNDLEQRVEALERFQARVFGLAAGIGIGSGVGSAWLVQVITG